MKYNLAVLAAAAALALTAAMPASAQTYSFSATLTGAAESPPVATTAGGSVLVTFNSMANSVSVMEWFFDLSSGLTGNHTHCCTATPGTGNSGVVLNFAGPLGATTGTYSNTFTLAPATYTTLLNGALAGKAYVNVHTSANPNGEIRGFLQLVSVVPEPSSYALMLGGLAAVGFMARRRRS